MIRTGQSVENPLTGERLTFLETSRDTNGDYVVVETLFEPGARVAAAHVHPYQTERFEVIEGTVGMKVGGEKIEALAGEVVTVDPVSRTSSTTRATVRPASSARSARRSTSSS